MSGFEAQVRFAGTDRLLISHKVAGKPLPITHLQQIRKTPGVLAAAPGVYLGGWYRDPRNLVGGIATDPDVLPAVDPRIIITPDHLEAFRKTRIGAIAGTDLADRYQWKIGDRITLNSPWIRKDGSHDWEFEIVGFFHLDGARAGRRISATDLYVNYDYIEEARAWVGLLNAFNVLVAPSASPEKVARDIDAAFQNSSGQTRTQSEAVFVSASIKRLGNVALIVHSILSTVFFTLILVVANGMMQSFRERIPDLAVMKTLGFTDSAIALLLLAESLLVTLTAAIVGIAVAALLVPAGRRAFEEFVPALGISAGATLIAIGIAGALGCLAATAPVWLSTRVTVTEALRD